MIKLKDLILENLNELVPDVLYHATFNALIPGIQHKGIIPGGTDVKNFLGIESGVYLASNTEFAGSMVEGTENENIPQEWFDEIVICVIDTTKLDITKFGIDPNIAPQEDEYDDTVEPDDTVYSYIYRGNIPANAISKIIDYD